MSEEQSFAAAQNRQQTEIMIANVQKNTALQ